MARFGNIAMMPVEPVPHPQMPARVQVSFLAEVKSLCGYSGSPVFVYLPLEETRRVQARPGRSSQDPLGDDFGPWLLGVDWGQVLGFRGDPTGLAGVVPAWFLSTFLNSSQFADLRKAMDEKLLREQGASATALDAGE